MQQNRWIRHILFWLVFFGISLFNELYLSESFYQDPDIGLFFQILWSVSCIYMIKILVVYTFLYLLLPLWENSRRDYRFYFLCLFVILSGTILIRMITQLIIWPYISGVEHTDLPWIQVIARFFYSMLDLLQITGVAVAIKLFMLRIKLLNKEKSLIREKLSAELNHLKAQTNPHFLFNALNSIYSLSRKKSEDTPTTILQLSHILRYMLYETDQKLLPVEKEIAALEQYVSIQNLRFSSKESVLFEKEIENDNIPFPPLLSFPIIENIFKHGALNESASIHFKISKNSFLLRTENYIGAPEDENNIRNGLGLRNLNRQLELLYKKYELDYRKEGNRFIVSLTIDLNSYAYTEMPDHRR